MATIIWAFIDYENIGSLETIDFDCYERVLVFCGKHNTKIKIGEKSHLNFISIDIFKLDTVGHNNLDFHIAYYLGKFSESVDKKIEYHVISKDNGFNSLVKHIQKSGRICKKIAIHNKAENKNLSLSKNLSSDALLVIKRLRQIDGRKRPRKEEKLRNWIITQCKVVNEKVNIDTVFNEIVKEGIVEIVDTGIRYKL